jgi:hypothetical protein
MHKKWNSYVYLEPDTTIGNFEVRITTFIVTTRPLQFTHCVDIRFLWHNDCEIQWSLILPVIQFWVIHFKTLPYTESGSAFSAVHCSAFLRSFSGLLLVSLCTHTLHAHWNFPSSLACVTGIVYINCSLPTSLLVWLRTWIFRTALASNPSVTFS